MKSANFSKTATLAGFGAILLWSTTVAVGRSLSESLGPVAAAAATYVTAGLLSTSLWIFQRSARARIGKLPRRYLIGCGLLFLTYTLALFLGLGLASDRMQVLEVGLLNYLWPCLILLFSIPVLHKKPGWMLIPGTLLAMGGLFLVMTQGEDVSFQSLLMNTARNPIAYGMGLTAAVTWASYSVLTTRWAEGERGSGVVYFLPATGLVLALVALFVPEARDWRFSVLLEILFLGGATFGGYALWDMAMRRGDVTLVAAASYFTPLMATLVAVWYLSAVPDPILWVGCMLLIIGSITSGWAFSKKRSASRLS